MLRESSNETGFLYDTGITQPMNNCAVITTVEQGNTWSHLMASLIGIRWKSFNAMWKWCWMGLPNAFGYLPKTEFKFWALKMCWPKLVWCRQSSVWIFAQCNTTQSIVYPTWLTPLLMTECGTEMLTVHQKFWQSEVKKFVQAAWISSSHYSYISS